MWVQERGLAAASHLVSSHHRHHLHSHLVGTANASIGRNLRALPLLVASGLFVPRPTSVTPPSLCPLLHAISPQAALAAMVSTRTRGMISQLQVSAASRELLSVVSVNTSLLKYSPSSHLPFALPPPVSEFRLPLKGDALRLRSLLRCASSIDPFGPIPLFSS